MNSLSCRRAIRNNTKEDNKLEKTLNHLNSSSLGCVSKIREEMRVLKQELVENRKVFGTRCALEDLRIENAGKSVDDYRRSSSEERNGKVDSLARGDSSTAPSRRMLTRARLSVPNCALLGNRRPSPPPPRVLEALKEPSVNGNPSKCSRSIGTISSPRSLSSVFSPDGSTGLDSVTKRGERPRGSLDLGRHLRREFGRRSSLPVCSTPALTKASPQFGQLPDSTPREESRVKVENQIVPDIKIEGQVEKSKDLNRVRSQLTSAKSIEALPPPRVRRYSLPICNLEEDDRWLLTAKLPLGKYGSQDAVQARLAQLTDLGLIKTNKKVNRRVSHGRRPMKIVSPVIESNSEKHDDVGIKNRPGASYHEFLQKSECVQDEDIDQEDGYRPCEDPKLQGIPKITLTEKMERFFAEYVEGAGQKSVADFEQLMMECRIAQRASEDTTTNPGENENSNTA